MSETPRDPINDSQEESLYKEPKDQENGEVLRGWRSRKSRYNEKYPEPNNKGNGGGATEDTGSDYTQSHAGEEEA